MRADMFSQGILGAQAFLVQRFQFLIQAPESRLVVLLEGSELLRDEFVQLLLDFIQSFAKPLALGAGKGADRLSPVRARNVIGAGIQEFPIANRLNRITGKGWGRSQSFRDGRAFVPLCLGFEQS